MTEPKQINVITAMKTAYAWKASVTRNAGTSMSQKRISLSILVLFLSVGAAFAQGTIMPPPIFTGLDSSGNPLVSGKLCTYVAGTTTPATTYTTSALDPLAANTNPVILNSAGRATVFLRPGSSYKFVLYSAGSDTTCNTGTLQWSQDNISALPTSNVNLDFDGTAGESLAAGDVVYLKDSTGWYKADADAAASSSEAAIIGMAPAAIASGATGTIRIKGLVTVTGPLTAAATYYVSATAGALTSTAPTLVRNVGVGYTATSILVSPANEGKLPALSPSYVLNALQIATTACGRLTLSTGVPITTADVTAATTVYYTPAGKCNQIGLYTSSSVWNVRTFAEVSIAVPATTNTLYDVFAYDNAGAVTLELSAAWNNSAAGTSARHAAGTYASILPTQDGVYVKSTNGTTIDATRRYLGSFRTTGVSGQTEDSFAKRLVWNVANQAVRPMRKTEATNTWNYTTAAWQQANASAANQIEFVIGLIGVQLESQVFGGVYNSGGNSGASIGIGVDTVAAPTSGNLSMRTYATTNGGCYPIEAELSVLPSVGFHYAAWLEYSITTTGTTTWCGDDNTPTLTQSGMVGRIFG